MRKLLFRSLISFCIAGVTPNPPLAAAQEPQSPVRLSTRVVNIDVLVTDKRTGTRVEDLKKEGFEVLDNGRPVVLTHFSRGTDRDRPLAIILLIDIRENTTRSNVPYLRAALESTLAKIRPDDEIGVMDYYGGHDLVQELTRDRSRVLDALSFVAKRQVEEKDDRHKETLSLSGWGTGKELAWALLAAMHHAQSRLPQARIGLIVISDDLTGAPRELVEKTAVQLIAGGAIVSGLIKVSGWFAKTGMLLGDVYSADPRFRGFPFDNIAYYSAQTGGEFIKVRGHNYGEALERAIGDLGARYSLGFIPDEGQLDGRFHSLEAKVKASDRLGKTRKLVVRARRGYVASKKQN